MKKNFSKALIIVAVTMIALPALALALPALAQPSALTESLEYVEPLELADADPREAAVSLVRLLMTFLGIIAVVIILYGGFVWLTAAGNEDKVASAKKIIAAGIIGLVIILAAFLIVNFVVENVSESLGG